MGVGVCVGGGGYACLGVRVCEPHSFWAPHAEENAISARDESFNSYSNIWVADLSHMGGLTEIDGLRIDGKRAIRAKYPNGYCMK